MVMTLWMVKLILETWMLENGWGSGMKYWWVRWLFQNASSVSECVFVCVLWERQSEKREGHISWQGSKSVVPQLLHLHPFVSWAFVDINKSFICINVRARLCVCISEIESGSRVLRTHKLGLIFCLITQWQARGCPGRLHAIGALASARKPQCHTVTSVGRAWLTISKQLSICPQRLGCLPGFYYSDVIFSHRKLFLLELWYTVWGALALALDSTVMLPHCISAADKLKQKHQRTKQEKRKSLRPLEVPYFSVPHNANMVDNILRSFLFIKPHYITYLNKDFQGQSGEGFHM